jgi:hypothetical protein
MKIISLASMKFFIAILFCSAFFTGKVYSLPHDLGWGPIIPTGLNLYVDNTGNDNGDGSINAPWKTISKAQSYIQSLKTGAGLPEKGVTVWIRGGRYQLTKSLSFTTADNGTADKPIIYRAFNNEMVSLFIGKVINPSLWKPLSVDARTRVHPKVNPDSLLEVDVNALGVLNSGVFPDKFLTWTLFDFIVDDFRQPVAQWPNLTENIRGLNDPGWITCNGSRDVVSFCYGPGGKPVDGNTVNEVDLDGSNRIQRWKASMAAGHNLWIKGFWRTPWSAWAVRVSEINSNGQWIKLGANADNGMGSKYTANADATGTYRVGDGKEKWCAINYLDEIDLPGEWAYDFKDKKVYYWPVKKLKDITSYFADNNEPVVTINGASNIRFIAFTIEGSQGNGFSLTNASNISISGCTIQNVGAIGINDDGGMNNLYQSNNICETGSSGVNIVNSGNRLQLIPSNVKVINNHIHHTGRLSYTYGLVATNSVGLIFVNNLIHDIPAGGFQTRLINNCLFEYNEIHNVALKVSDMGGYYGYGGWTCYGNEIRYNFLHHLNRSNGLYSDDGTSGKNFHHNIIQNSLRPFHIGGGHHNLCQNSLIVECLSSASIDDRGISRFYYVSNNFGKAVKDMNPFNDPWKTYGKQLMTKYNYPASDSLWKSVLDTLWHPEWPNGSMLIDNVEVKSKGFSKPAHGSVTISGNVSLANVSDAGFADYANMDLRTTNADILSKFPDLNIAFPLMGLQIDEYRTRVVTRAETGGLVNRGTSGDPWYEDPVARRE